MIELGIAFALILLGYFAGKAAESSHYKSIKEREKKTLHMPAVNTRTLGPEMQVAGTTLACGSVVVSVDHFKRFMSGLRLLVGGEVKSYSPLLDRGRREAILRMKESCPQADLFINMRILTSSISQGQGPNAMGTVEVLAYATAVKLVKDESRA